LKPLVALSASFEEDLAASGESCPHPPIEHLVDNAGAALVPAGQAQLVVEPTWAIV
jgi:hypothetical protein